MSARQAKHGFTHKSLEQNKRIIILTYNTNLRFFFLFLKVLIERFLKIQRVIFFSKGGASIIFVPGGVKNYASQTLIKICVTIGLFIKHKETMTLDKGNKYP